MVKGMWFQVHVPIIHIYAYDMYVHLYVMMVVNIYKDQDVNIY